MRKVILNVAVSLDGFIESVHSEYDLWCFTDQDYGMTDFFKRTDTVFPGRKSYELVMREGNGYLRKMKQYVFSTTGSGKSLFQKYSTKNNTSTHRFKNLQYRLCSVVL